VRADGRLLREVRVLDVLAYRHLLVVDLSNNEWRIYFIFFQSK
jgi:hypothetical protein